MNWLSLFHIHSWLSSRINPYGIVTEQRCRCGKYRHHTFKDAIWLRHGGEVKWREGRHPQNTEESKVINEQE
jgi:hypothetical protein